MGEGRWGGDRQRQTERTYPPGPRASPPSPLSIAAFASGTSSQRLLSHRIVNRRPARRPDCRARGGRRRSRHKSHPSAAPGGNRRHRRRRRAGQSCSRRRMPSVAHPCPRATVQARAPPHPAQPRKAVRPFPPQSPAVDAQLGLPFSCAARDSLRPRTAEAPTGSACGAEGLGATVRRSCPAPPRPSFRAHHCAASLLPQVRSVAGFPATQAAGSGRQASFWAGGW